MSSVSSNNPRRLPSTPDSPSKPIDNKNEPTPANIGNLVRLVPKQSPNSSPRRPRLPHNVQESPEADKPVDAEAFESPSSPPQKPPPPIPRRAKFPTSDHPASEQLTLTGSAFGSADLPEVQPEPPIRPTSPTRVQRPLTSSPSIKKPIVSTLARTESKEQKNSSLQASSTFLLSSRIPPPLDEYRLRDYGKEMNKLATELGISLRPQLERTRHVRQLSAVYRPRQQIVVSDATIQSDPSDAGSGSEDSDIKDD